MKHKPSNLKVQRDSLDQKLVNLKNLATTERPKSGWMKAVRESLGMTTEQLGRRLKISAPAITKLEKNEELKKISLESLEKAAHALQCRLVYAIVPEAPGTSLENIIDNQARKAAKKVSTRVAHSMALEKQNISQRETDVQTSEIAQKLKDKMNSKIWDEK